MWGEVKKLDARADPLAAKAYARGERQRCPVRQVEDEDKLCGRAQGLGGLQQRPALTEVEQPRRRRDPAVK